MSDFLAKKNNKGGLAGGRGIAPMQGRQGVMPSGGVSNTNKQSYGNTKAASKHVPVGKPHAKVMGSNPTQVGKYL